jgi:hypothetical protein
VAITLVPIVNSRSSAVTGFCFIMQDLAQMIANRDRIRDLEDTLWRRVAARTARLTEEVEQLRLTVAQYSERYGTLPAREPSFREPKKAPASAIEGEPLRCARSDSHCPTGPCTDVTAA